MNVLRLLAFLSAQCFWMWPLMLVASGLKGNVGTAVYAGGAFLCIAVFSVPEIIATGIPTANWKLAAISCITGSAGVIMFTRMMFKAPEAEQAPLFTLSLVLEVIGLAVYQLATKGGMSYGKGAGFVLGAVSIVLLMRGK